MRIQSLVKIPETKEYDYDYVMKMVMIIIPIPVVVLFVHILLLVCIQRRKRKNIERPNCLIVTSVKNPEYPEPRDSENALVPNRKIDKAISVIEFSEYYEQVSLQLNKEIKEEYKKLASEAKKLECSLGLTVEAGKDPAVANRNRFVNILTYDQNRVKVGAEKYPLDYINASYIPFSDDLDKVECIALQSPNYNSIGLFWEMIWEQNINCIIMLTRTIEGDEMECLQYWPNDMDKSLLFGNENQFKVTLLEEDENESHIERTIEVENTKINAKRQIVQIHMDSWLDESFPKLDDLDKMLFRFHEITNDNLTHPYLVHCSAGVGSSGTVICIDRIIKELIKGSSEIDIYNEVLKLRTYRNLMVQREDQYLFIYEYINHFLSKYLNVSEGEDEEDFDE